MMDQEKIDLLSKVLEYEHALEHIAWCSEDSRCEQCVRLADGALQRLNKDMCDEMAAEQLESDSGA